MGPKKFIYDNGTDAFSYFVVFFLSMFLPTIICLITDEPLLLLLTMVINSIGLIRDYLSLIKFKITTKRFWIERLIGVIASVAIFMYSISEMLFILNGLENDIFVFLNIVFSILFLFPGVISVIEGILHLKQDFGDNVVDDVVVIAESTATDV